MVGLLSGLACVLGLALLVLPLPRVRHFVFKACSRFLQAASLACLGACGTFFVQPSSAPNWLTPHVHGLLAVFSADNSLEQAHWPWLLIAIACTLVVLPLLMLLELALSLSEQTSLVRSLQNKLRQTAQWIDHRLLLLGYEPAQLTNYSPESNAMHEVFQLTASSASTKPQANLVIDLMK